MKTLLITLLVWIVTISEVQTTSDNNVIETHRWREQSLHVKIIRDNWGIAHIYGKSDADAVFGMVYAQCEDDFQRVERNYLTATARMAEAFGEDFIYHDLRTRLFQDSIMALEVYKASPEWLKKLCNAFADGINYYLYNHPEVKTNVIKRYEPWMPFLFSEGSIGGDIETVSLKELKDFYNASSNSSTGGTASVKPQNSLDMESIWGPEPTGSNGISIAPSKTKNGNSLFLINPHTSFYFRSEIHVNSEEGLNTYGATTWGQFFVYQGFNEKCGWMHTSSEADCIDEYEETTGLVGDKFFYNYGNVVKQGTVAPITIKYKTSNGYSTKSFKTYYTQHGPVVANRGDKWITVRMMHEPMKALMQSFTRTKSKGYSDFEKSMKLRTNSSNNTVYADADGNIAYWHGNYIPKRNTKFNWNKPVDGSNPETEWKELHELREIIHVKNPSTGWIQNCNNTPFNVSGEASPQEGLYPEYMAPDEENPRGIHAVRVLKDSSGFTLDKLIGAAFDSYQPAFAQLIPSLMKAKDALPVDDTLKAELQEPLELLKKWNYRWSASSIETTLAIWWATKLRQQTSPRYTDNDDLMSIIDFLDKKTYPHEKLLALKAAIASLEKDFGSWRYPWGEVNRFQRITPNIEATFDDNQQSITIPFTSAFWGSLASYGSKQYPNTKRMYGTGGNSFVAAVEFGKRLKAKAVTIGGASGNPSSPNFNDQSKMYATGRFKDVYFYYEDVVKNAVKVYYPGQ